METTPLAENFAGCPSDQGMAGKADICSNCPGRQSCLAQGAPDPDQKFIDIRMNAIKRKILILSGKGGIIMHHMSRIIGRRRNIGVGKSSIAASLSMALAQICGHKKVGILDLDICGPSIPQLLQVNGQSVINTDYGWKPLDSPYGDIKVMSTGLLISQDQSAIIWRGPRKTALIKRFLKDTFWGRLDYLICDTPPGTSDEHLSVVKLLLNANPEGAIIVTTPQEISLATIRKEIDFCSKMGVAIIGLIENMSGHTCPCCHETVSLFSGEGIEKLVKDYNIPLLGRIPFDPNFINCCDNGKSIIETFPTSTATLALLDIAKQIHTLKKK